MKTILTTGHLFPELNPRNKVRVSSAWRQYLYTKRIQADRHMKKTVINFYRDYLRNGEIPKSYVFTQMFQWLEEIGLITLSRPEKIAIFEESKKEVRREYVVEAQSGGPIPGKTTGEAFFALEHEKALNRSYYKAITGMFEHWRKNELRADQQMEYLNKNFAYIDLATYSEALEMRKNPRSVPKIKINVSAKYN